MAEKGLPNFDDVSRSDDPRTAYTETIDLGELAQGESAFSDTLEIGGRLPESVRKLLHSLPIPAMLIRRRYSIAFMNESWAKIVGTYRNAVNRSVLTLFPRREDETVVESLLEKVFLDRNPQAFDGLLEIEGVRRWCRINMRSVRFGDERSILALIEDLTPVRKQLLLSARHKNLLRAARDQLERRVERRTSELRTTNERLQKEIAERRRAERNLRQAHDELEKRVGERTAELRTANDQLRLEIDERRRAEEKLSLAGKVIESSNEAIVITDAEGDIVDANLSFTKVTGYGVQEVLGKNPVFLQDPRQDPDEFPDVWNIARERGSFQGETRNRHKDGHVYPVLLSLSVIRTEDGRVTHYVGIFSDITWIKQTEERLQQLAHNDPLTGLPNRVLFRDRMEQAMAQAQRHGRQVVLMMLDLDRFKNINDTFGHGVGDELLGAAAERLKSCVRKSDTVARLGGDEFLIVLAGDIEIPGAARVAQKIIETMSGSFTVGGRKLFITASMGIALYPTDGTEVARLLQNADTALYHVKQQGKNGFQFFSAEMNLRVMEKLELELDLRAALERKEFILHYQPIMDIQTTKIVCAEALLRWKHPRRGLLEPAKFIPLAEETGLIIPIGEWVLRTACSQIRALQEIGLSAFPVAVNLSSRQLRQEQLAETILSLLKETRLSPKWLELELTESVADDDAESTRETFSALRKSGISISIDDFGTGYSSLSYLKRFPVDKIKIDRSFVKDIVSDNDDSAIVKAIVSVAHSLDIRVVAEGVETDEQLSVLREHGCDEWQGFGFLRPMPIDELTRTLLNDPTSLPTRAKELPRPEPRPTQFEQMADWILPPFSRFRDVEVTRPPGLYCFKGRRRMGRE